VRQIAPDLKALNVSNNLMEILNYMKISKLIQTSGQPKPEEFELIRLSGVETIINLAMPDSDSAISNEGELVSKNNMNYIHIPVVWQKPKKDQFNLFKSVMEFHKEKSIWVHCALNWRVSSFIYLYRTKSLGVPESEANKLLTSVWEPNETWSKFISNNV